MGGVEVKGKKKKLIPVIIVSALMIILLMLMTPGDICIVTSTSGFISSTDHFYAANLFLPVKIPVLFGKPDLDELEAETETLLTGVRDRVLRYDPDAFCGEYASMEDCFFIIDRYVYYFRTNDVEHFYRLDTETGEIKQCKFSGYDSFAGHLTSRDRFKEVSHNYVVMVSIRSEGLIDHYPKLKDAIEQTDGEFYCRYMYCAGDRIFFDMGNKIYEYLPDSNRTKRIASVAPAETVERIIVR